MAETSTLMLRFAGPMQAWGDSSRFNHRHTREAPTKSGVLGLLAAASGRRRTDPIEDLAGLRFGVRTDQPGTIVRDFQTEIDWRTGRSQPLTQRYYLADAVFVAGVEGPTPLLEGLRDALLRPVYPLYLGRRACPPSGRLVLGCRSTHLESALHAEPWQAARWHRRQQPARVDLAITRDCLPGETAHESTRDHPLTFDPAFRQYGWRDVVHERGPSVDNPDARQLSHDPIGFLGGH
jgi:CRISPR system Cascade subunit CasD